jgi:predicted NodU family carbamoyl transferase
MKHIGISCGFHDAAITVINHRGNIEFASHSERYSGIKHDSNLHRDLVTEAQQHYAIAQFNYYERPLIKYLRQIRSGDYSKLPTWNNLLTPEIYAQLGKPKLRTWFECFFNSILRA